jgi:hypothetical protein
MQINSNTHHRPTFARFPLGQTYITPGAEEALMWLDKPESSSCAVTCPAIGLN